MNNVIHGGAAPKNTTRVFLLSGTALTGEAVCFNYDALTVTPENDALAGSQATNSAADWTDARRVMVEPPLFSNNMGFAGIISRVSDNVVGPNWIEVHVPGSTCEIRTVATVSAGIGGDYNTGACLTFTVGTNSIGAAHTNNGRFEKTGLCGEGTAMLLAEGAASVPGDSYLKMATLQTGPPSGGVQTGTLITTLASSTAVKHGVINLNNTDLTTEAETAAAISISDGVFIGQKLVVVGPTAANSIAVAISFASNAIIPGLSTTYVPVTAATLSSPDAVLAAEWTGGTWLVNASDTTIS